MSARGYNARMEAGARKPRSIFAIAHDAIATIVRPASVVAFGVQMSSLAVGWPGYVGNLLSPASFYWGRVRFAVIDRLTVLCAATALGCIVACGVVAILRRWCPGERLKSTSCCLWLSIATIVLLVFFAPAIASA